MSDSQRMHEVRGGEARIQGPGGESDGESLAGARDAGDRYLQAAEDAINRALSANSEAFLAAARQTGGQ